MAYGNSANPDNWTSCTSSIGHEIENIVGTATVYMRWQDALGNETLSNVTQEIYYGYCGDGNIDSWNNEQCDLGGDNGQ